MDFIAKSPSCFHAVRAAEQCLRAGGFERLHEEEAWRVLPGHAYYVIRNNSSIISFFVPDKMFPAFRMCASHCDSPAFKVKEMPEIKAGRSCITNNTTYYIVLYILIYNIYNFVYISLFLYKRINISINIFFQTLSICELKIACIFFAADSAAGSSHLFCGV